MKDNMDFTTGSIFKKILKFMFPILGSLLIQAMYGAVDLMIVGKFGTTEGISGVSTGGNVTNLVTFSMCGLTAGVMILLGRYVGEKNEQKIAKLIGGAFCFFGVLSVVISAVLVVFAKQFAILMQAPGEALQSTTTYIRICGCGFVFVVFYNLISSIFRGVGNSRLPLLFISVSCSINIIGDLLLVGLFKMNVAGAAIATIFAQGVSVFLSLSIMIKKGIGYKITRKDFRFSKQVSDLIKVGIPLAFQELLTNFTFFVICAFVNRLGLSASSGYGITGKVFSFFYMIPSAICQSLLAFVSQNSGAGLEDRAKSAMKQTMVAGAIIGTIFGIVSFFFGDVVASIFTNDKEVISCASECLKGMALEIVFTPIMFSYTGYFNGHSKSLFIMVQGMLQSFLVRLPVSYFMSFQKVRPLLKITSATPIATFFGLLTSIGYYIFLTKKMKNEKIS